YGRLTGLVGLALAGLQLGQIGADARCQLGCRLISERETQYLLRGYALMTDEPHDARRHDRGLTRARPRHVRLGSTPVSGDRFKLRISESDADDLPQLIALADGTPGAHEWPPMIQAPSGWAGQAARNSQVRHRSGDGVAGKSSRRMWPAAADTCCHAGESSSRAACFCTFGSSGALAPHGIRNCTKEAPPLVAPGATSPVPPYCTATWYTPSWGCSATCSLPGAVFVVFRSITTTRPSASSSTRSMEPRSVTGVV